MDEAGVSLLRERPTYAVGSRQRSALDRMTLRRDEDEGQDDQDEDQDD